MTTDKLILTVICPAVRFLRYDVLLVQFFNSLLITWCSGKKRWIPRAAHVGQKAWLSLLQTMLQWYQYSSAVSAPHSPQCAVASEWMGGNIFGIFSIPGSRILEVVGNSSLGIPKFDCTQCEEPCTYTVARCKDISTKGQVPQRCALVGHISTSFFGGSTSMPLIRSPSRVT